MSKEPRSEALSAYQAKRQDTEARLAKQVLAYVRLSASSKEVAGYVIVATSGKLGGYTHENFKGFYVAPPDAQSKDVRSVIQEAQRRANRLYDPKGGDFHSCKAAESLAAYARYILEERSEPRGLAVLALFVEHNMKNDLELRLVDYTGSVREDLAGKGGFKIFLGGCYDLKLRKAVHGAIRRHTSGKSMSMKSVGKLVAELRAITKLREVGCMGIGR